MFWFVVSRKKSRNSSCFSTSSNFCGSSSCSCNCTASWINSNRRCFFKISWVIFSTSCFVSKIRSNISPGLFFSGRYIIKFLLSKILTMFVNICSICLTNFEDKYNFVIKTNCNPVNHIFCYSCSKKWFVNNNSCPYCRQVVVEFL